jgi:hypothetical protein
MAQQDHDSSDRSFERLSEQSPLESQTGNSNDERNAPVDEDPSKPETKHPNRRVYASKPLEIVGKTKLRPSPSALRIRDYLRWRSPV